MPQQGTDIDMSEDTESVLYGLWSISEQSTDIEISMDIKSMFPMPKRR
jgi:hypothetical protein